MDFDGSFLKSLSLDDAPRNQFATDDATVLQDQSTYSHEYVDDDFMELDEPEHFHEEIIKEYVVEEAENPEPVEEKAPSILSPTSLGAYVATKPRALIMAPPAPEKTPRSVSTSYDFECETSAMKRHNTSVLQKGSLDLFLAKDEAEEYVYDPTFGYVKVPETETTNANFFNGYPSQNHSAMGNAMSRSYGYRQMNETMNQTQNQNHNQYQSQNQNQNQNWNTNPVQNQNSNSNLNLNGSFNSNLDQRLSSNLDYRLSSNVNSSPTSRAVHHHHYYYSEAANTAAASSQQMQKFHSPEGLEVYKNPQYSLPPPWKTDIHPHERYPYIISSYLQLLVNISISGYLLELVYSIIRTVKNDINQNLEKQTQNLLLEIETCRRSWVENQCAPDTVVPLVQRQCDYWYQCMNQDPRGGGRTMATGAQTIGIVINSLVEPLSAKFILVLVLSIVLIFGLNFLFGYVRAKLYYGQPPSGGKADPTA